MNKTTFVELTLNISQLKLMLMNFLCRTKTQWKQKKITSLICSAWVSIIIEIIINNRIKINKCRSWFCSNNCMANFVKIINDIPTKNYIFKDLHSPFFRLVKLTLFSNRKSRYPCLNCPQIDQSSTISQLAVKCT